MLFLNYYFNIYLFVCGYVCASMYHGVHGVHGSHGIAWWQWFSPSTTPDLGFIKPSGWTAGWDILPAQKVGFHCSFFFFHFKGYKLILEPT